MLRFSMLKNLRRKESDKSEEETVPSREAFPPPPPEVDSAPPPTPDLVPDTQGSLEEDSKQELQEDTEQEDQDESAGEETEPKDSLLNIFKMEDAGNVEIESLMSGLEEIDIHELLEESRVVAQRLRE